MSSRDVYAGSKAAASSGMTWEEYHDAMMSYDAPGSDAEGMNLDDYRGSLDACDVVFGVDFVQVEGDTEQTRRELGLHPAKEDRSDRQLDRPHLR